MSASHTVRAVVIGGGVVGCAVLRELARRGVEALLVEAEPDLCEGTSKANSAIVHTGFDTKAGTIEARLTRRAAALWPSVVEELAVPFLRVGALMLARTSDERGRLQSEVAARATAVGVRTELLERDALREIAPYVTPEAVAALSIPDEAVIDPFWLTRAYAEAAVASGGAAVRLGSAVAGLAVRDDGVRLELADGSTILAQQAFDCAGLRADEVAGLAGDRSFSIGPRKGQFLVSEETFGVDRIVLPIPGPMGKGMLVTPIVFGGLLLGPTAVAVGDKADRSTDPAERDRILAACRSMVPAVADMVPIRSFAGLRTVSSTGDYVLRPSAAGDRLWIVAGIRSTGISASPAIAEEVVAGAMRARGWGRAAVVRAIPAPPMEFTEEPGEVVCVCRGVSRGEIVAALRRPVPATTLDAVKRRCGATFGDCQGNLCVAGVARIIASERGVPATEVEKGPIGSWIFAESPNARATRGRTTYPPRLPAAADVIIVGGGQAGRAALGAVRTAGLRALVVDRREGLTAIGLAEAPDGWLVLGQTSGGAVELLGRSVVLATGGYVEPREHRSIAGPRPAGVVTADFVDAALESGLVPGRSAVVVGATSRARATADALEAAGCAVLEVAPADPPELRGEGRLTGVRFGGRWIDCDTLVFADRLLPQTFLLRGLGLADGRPGVPAPVDGDGRLPLPGLWAAGCCVRADIDHAGCADDGLRVGRLVAAGLGARA